MLFALTAIAPYVCLLESAADYEAMWFTVHSDIGAVLLCVWYRPPANGETASIHTFEADWERLCERHIGTIVIGDLNLHHKWWLKHSADVTVEGSTMYKFTCDRNFKQIVRGPTRYEYLLDLVITDLDEAINATIFPRIADHNLVRAKFDLQVTEAEAQQREVFLYKTAKWAELRYDLRQCNWDWLSHLDVDSACERLTSTFDNLLRKHVRTTLISERATTHPWLNSRCKAVINAKRNAEGTLCFVSAAQRCSDVLMAEYFAYTSRMKHKLKTLTRG